MDLEEKGSGCPPYSYLGDRERGSEFARIVGCVSKTALSLAHCLYILNSRTAPAARFPPAKNSLSNHAPSHSPQDLLRRTASFQSILECQENLFDTREFHDFVRLRRPPRPFLGRCEGRTGFGGWAGLARPTAFVVFPGFGHGQGRRGELFGELCSLLTGTAAILMRGGELLIRCREVPRSYFRVRVVRGTRCWPRVNGVLYRCGC